MKKRFKILVLVFFAALFSVVVVRSHTQIHAAVPSVITDLRAGSLDGALQLTWTAPAAVPAVTDYKIYYRMYSTSDWILFDDGVSTYPAVTITGLTNNVGYECIVRAVNDDGTSEDSNISYSVPLPEIFSDDFESYTVGNSVSGLNGWQNGGAVDWKVGSDGGSQVLTDTGVAGFYTTKYVSNGTASGRNVRIKFDAKHPAAASQPAIPQIWLRKGEQTGAGSGYLIFLNGITDSFYVLKEPGFNIVAGPVPVTLNVDEYYTFEAEAITLPTGAVRINVYVYAIGETRGAPALSYTDSSATYNNPGYFALGSNYFLAPGATAYYDNVSYYEGNLAPLAPFGTHVSYTGILQEGMMLTGQYTYADVNGDPEGASTFRWLRADTKNGTYTPIVGATSSTYYLTADDVGKYIKFEYTPVSTVAPTQGSPVLSDAKSQVVDQQFWHILVTGQSLAVGQNAGPAITTGPIDYFANYMPDTGVESTDGTLSQLFESGNGSRGDVETPTTAIASTITSLGGIHPIVMSNNAVSGFSYSQLKKGTAPYTKGITQATNIKDAVEGDFGMTYKPKAIVLFHGEADWLYGNSALYPSYLREWQDNYKTDLNVLAGTTEEIPIFETQMNAAITGEMAEAQLKAHKDYPGKIILVGPKYQFGTFGDYVHLTNGGSRAAGELVGKVIKKSSF